MPFSGWGRESKLKSFFADEADFNGAVGFRTATPKRLRFF